MNFGFLAGRGGGGVSKIPCRLLLLAIIGISLDAGWAADSETNRTAWSAQKPALAEGKIADWVPAPEFLAWRKADPVTDGFAGNVLSVNLTGPFHRGAWSQHAGALFALPRTFAAGESFSLRFKARSLEGPQFLSVLRTWGGAKPWDAIPITGNWADYEVTLTPQADMAETGRVTFSLVAQSGGLHPYCAGRFELSEVTLVAGHPPDAESALDAYFAEPKDLPYDEETLAEKQEDGWHWRQFRYTSLVYGGEPIRIHAVYAAPDQADEAHPVPAILMTHGIFGAVRGGDPRYWSAVTSFVKAGYAVLFFDWYPNFAHDFKPKSPDEPKPFSTFGKLDYFPPSNPGGTYTLPGNDWKDSLHYQVVMAAKRGVSWLQARPEVDGKAIGATGWSYGGIFSSMIAGIDPRIAAVNPCVYTARFGPGEGPYNDLNDKELKDESVLRLWQSRFDSFTLLAKRSVPVLYTIGANDEVFSVTKAMECFAAMAGPKHLLIGPNEGHGYWAVPQGIHFFDSVLKKSGAQPTVSNLALRLEGPEVVASVQTSGEIKEVEFFVATVFEKDPIRGWTGIPAFTWKWTGVKAVKIADGGYEARWPLPVMRPTSPRETLHRWGEGDRFDPAAPPPAVDADKLQGAIQVFARVTDTRGVQECSPLAQPLLFSDAAAAVAPIAHALPKLEAAVRVATKTVVDLTPALAGKPVATLDLPLPVQAVGKAGYVLWNWRKEMPSATLTTDGVATPTKAIAAPFADTIKPDSFSGYNPLPGPPFSTSGKLSFRINGKEGLADKVDGWHGSVAQGNGGAEEIQLQPQDDAEHRATLVMVGGIGEANVRVSVRAPDGAEEIVQYLQTQDADRVFQFRFAGPVVLRVETTSAPFRRQDGVAMQHLTPIGPSALFLD